jgi:zinc transport system substrate-binding protein
MFMKSLLATATASLLLVPALSGCAPDPKSSDTLSVVAAFYPLAFVAESVGGESVEVTNLTTPGSEPHDLELTAQQVASLSGADLVVYQKGFQPAVDAAIEANPPKNAIDVSTLVPLIESDHEDGDHEEDAGHDEGEEGHDHGAIDPHTWLNPKNMVAFTEAIGSELERLHPDSATTFATNASSLTEQLTTLDTDFADGLKTCVRREFVTSHEAFGYLAQRYQLTQIGIAGLDPTVEPSTARIAEIQQLVKRYGITTIFYETLTSPAVAESLAKDLGITTDILDPLEGLTEESRGSDYISVMRSNLKALQQANSCS